MSVLTRILGCMPSPKFQKKSAQLATRPGTAASSGNGAIAKVSKFAESVGAKSKTALATVNNGARRLNTSRTTPGSLPAMAQDKMPAFAASAVLGLADESSIGKQVSDVTGFARPSDILFGVGALLRATNMDANMPGAKKAFDHVFEAQGHDYARRLGGSIPSKAEEYIARRAAPESAPEKPKDVAPSEDTATKS